MPLLIRKRRQQPQSAFGSNLAVGFFAFFVAEKYKFVSLHEQPSRHIALTSFENHIFPNLTEHACLSLFRFRPRDLHKMVHVIAWPLSSTRTRRNRYAVSPLLATCVLLRRLASPTRWRDLETFFGRHSSQLSEIFNESLHWLVKTRVDLVMEDVSAPSWQARFDRYAQAVYRKSGALQHVVGFIDGTVIAIARPGGDPMLQRVVYNGHKRKHAINYQAITTPCGMAMHLAGPIEGRRHDWTLYIQSGADDMLLGMCTIDGVQFYVYGDSGYSIRPYLFVPFSGSNLEAAQRAFNKAMSGSRVTVEWFFKEVKKYWTTLDFKRKMCLGESSVGTMYIAGVLLTNFRNCIYPNTISQYFKCRPPTLEEYLQHRD